MRHRQRGFTIIELLTVVALIGIVAAVSIPAVKSFGRSADIRANAKRMAADFWLARQRAIATSTAHSVFFDPDEGQYTVFQDDGGGNPANAGNGEVDAGETVIKVRDVSGKCSITDVFLDPPNTVIFVPKGTLKDGTWGGSLSLADCSGRTRQIFISTAGFVRVE
jgi:type II secretion system protein H